MSRRGAVLGLVVVLGLTGCACAGSRPQGAAADGGVTDGLVAYLAREVPEAKVVSRTADTLELAVGETRMAVALENLREKTAGKDAAGRQQVFAGYADALRAQLPGAPAGDELAQLRPRLLSAQYAAALADKGPMLQRPLVGTSLVVAYVVDSPRHVRFLKQDDAQRLGLTLEALEARALENLGRLEVGVLRLSDRTQERGSMEQVLALVGEGEGVVLLTGDTFDAARLLLLPGLLEEGQVVAAIAAERDGLMLLPDPGADGWGPLRDMGQRLYDETRADAQAQALSPTPLRVTRAGVEAAR